MIGGVNVTGAIEIEVQDEALLAALQTKSDQMPDKLNDLINEAGFIVQRHAVEEAPRRTGNLKGSIRVEENGPLSRIVYPDQGVAPYALYVILGTAPHTIQGNPWLYWDGAEHPVRQVQHPGTAPNPFLDEASDASEAEIDAEVEKFEQWCSDLG